jgi:hypothetical protein
MIINYQTKPANITEDGINFRFYSSLRPLAVLA